MANLKSSSPTIRRTAASSAVSVCQHSRRTSYFYTWLLNVLLGRTHYCTLVSSDICKLVLPHCAFNYSAQGKETHTPPSPFALFLGLVVPVDEEHPSHLILGVLLTLRYLMPLLQQQVNTISLKGSFGVMRKEADIQPTPEQLLQVERRE